MILAQPPILSRANRVLIPELVQQKHTDYGSLTSYAFTITTTPVEGNLMIMCVGGNQDRVATFPGGWSQLNLNNGGLTAVVGYKIAGAGEPTSVTVTFNLALAGSMAFQEYRNAEATILAQAIGSGFTTTTSHSIGTINVTSRSVFIQQIAFTGSIGSISINNGYLGEQPTARHTRAYKIYSNPGSDTTTWSFASSTGIVAYVIFSGKRI